MTLPLYVVQRDIVGNSTFENVVVLDTVGNVETLLYWDLLDELSKAAYDPFSGEVSIIPALKAATFRNQSLYEYLKYAIVEHELRTSSLPTKDDPIIEIQNRTFDSNYNSTRVGKYSSSNNLGVYTTTNVLTYISSYGPSRFRDRILFTGSSTVIPYGGKIRLQTGVTPGSEIIDETVEHGRYIPGSASDGSAAIFVQTPLISDQYVEVGIGNSSDSAVFHFNAINNDIRIMRGGILVDTIAQADWNINKCDGSDPDRGGIAFNLDATVDGYIYSVNYTWYGIGKILFSISTPLEGTPETLTTIPVHEYIPNGITFIDPNLPVRVTANNGTTSANVIVDIGGRKYDVHGEFSPETRKVITIIPLSSLSTRSSIFSIRKKDNFPEAGRENTVPVYLTDITVSSDAVGFVRAYTVPRGTISGSWVKPPEVIDVNETSIEVNTTITSITGVTTRENMLGPILILGATPQKVQIPNEKGSRTPIIDYEELVVEYDPVASSTGYVVVELTEEW